MDFIEHLKQAAREGRLAEGRSKLGDWLTLLSMEDLELLSAILEELKNEKSVNVDYIAALVYLLCKLEGYNFHKHHRDNPGLLLAEFLCMVNLEILARQGFIRLLQNLSFSEQGDFKVELLKSPPSLGFLPNLNMNMN